MPIRPRDFFQIGVLVSDLEAAIVQLSAALGYTFCPVFEGLIRMDDGDVVALPRMRMALTREFPHFKLVETIPTIARGLFERSGPLYYGVWVDDLEAESSRLGAAGLPVVLEGVDPGRPGVPWAYHEMLDGTLVELISRKTQPFYQALLDGSVPTGDFLGG